MSDLAKEIVDYVKLKDRDSFFELSVKSRYNNRMELLSVQVPVVDGQRAWKVDMTGRWEVSYEIENIHHI